MIAHAAAYFGVRVGHSVVQYRLMTATGAIYRII